MYEYIKRCRENVLAGGDITREEALQLMRLDIRNEHAMTELLASANAIRMHYVGDLVDLCTILNAKSGDCSEDCKFCAQSAHYKTSSQVYELIDYPEIKKRALEVQAQGAHRFSLVTSGRGAVDGQEFDQLLEIYRRLRKDTRLSLCASHGVINQRQAEQLKEAGVSMYHHNVETSESFYPEIVTTHAYEERTKTIKAVMAAGLEICSGGIFGLGERLEDRIAMAFELKALGVKSLPLNVLMPVEGTPLGNQSILEPMEILKTMAVYRFVIPESYIRYAGGRIALQDKQQLGFESGVNAALVGDFLTTIGSDVEQDKEMIRCAGMRI